MAKCTAHNRFEQVGTLDNQAYIESKEVSIPSYEEYQLLDKVEKLQQHAGYEVLLHTMWRQGDQGKAEAPKFHLRAGQDYSDTFNSDGSEKIIFTDTTVDEIQEETIDRPLYELDGVLQIYVQHYLFLETTLDLKAPSVREVVFQDQELELTETESNNTVQIGNLEQVSPTVIEERFLKSYRMKQKRRMRSSEFHYLDHPLLGIIVQVRRVPKAN